MVLNDFRARCRFGRPPFDLGMETHYILRVARTVADVRFYDPSES